MAYVGRFAPSPSGPLHFGSLIAATASYLDARHQNGQWLVRIDDIDRPRVVSGASQQILQTLEAYGFQWDGEIVYQSQRLSLYQDAITQLTAQNHAFFCDCSRKQIFQRQPQGLYQGFCRQRQLGDDAKHALRFAVPHHSLHYQDLIQGNVIIDPQTELGDFVIRRADGVMGYHLVCAVDDLAQGVTHVIRGCDLLVSGFAQRLVSQALASRELIYGHHPLAMSRDKIKLSKSAHSPAIDPQNAPATLWCVLSFLNQQPPLELQTSTLAEVWQWAITHWSLTAIPQRADIEVSS